jgi:AraC-like DNA-binding protein
MLMSALVTHDNAKVLLMQGEEMMRQASQLDQLHEMADDYLEELGAQRLVNWLALGFIFLLVGLFVLFYLYHLRKIALQRERVMHTLWNMQPDSISVGHEQNEESAAAALPTDAEEQEEDEPANVSLFITRFKEVVEARLEDSDVGVEELAADMSLSRVQLYRKVKAVTGSSPVELLRTARLNRAYQLLLTSDMSVSEVAYAVGFTAPSYFTKCFKEEYGMVPGDIRK